MILFSNYATIVITLCSLRHKNIVNVYGAVTEKKRLGIVMELCPSKLTTVILKCELNNVEKNVKALGQIAQGMSYLHMKNIIHRDLKADNILVFTKNLFTFGSV